MKHSITHTITILLLIVVCNAAHAQMRLRVSVVEPPTQSVVSAYVDSLAWYKAQLDSLTRANAQLSASKDDDAASFYRLFAPLSFYHGVAGSAVSGRRDDADDHLDSLIDATLLRIYINHPELVQTTEKKLHDSAQRGDVVPTAPIVRNVDVIKESEPVDIDGSIDDALELVVTRPNFWRFAGDYSMQFMQTQISNNWYQGGESNFSMLGSVVLQLNYDNKAKWKWDNKLEMKLGFQRNESESAIRTNSDLLRYTGKVGLQATKKWYYTLQALGTTQFAYGKKKNDERIYSAFLSPLTVNISLGLDYNVETKNKKYNASFHLAPFAYNLKYVDWATPEILSKAGLKDGKNQEHRFGSQCTINMCWKPAQWFKWDTRIYAFTPYDAVQFEWENTFTMSFTKYFSTIIYCYPRFDDKVKKGENGTHWQVKEYLSLGFTYSM